MQVMGNDPLLNYFNVQALKSKEFLKWFHEGENTPARESDCVITDEAGHGVHHRSGTAQELKTSMFRDRDDLVLPKLGTEQTHLIVRVSDAVVSKYCFQ